MREVHFYWALVHGSKTPESTAEDISYGRRVEMHISETNAKQFAAPWDKVQKVTIIVEES